jgi:hypothetical protein
MNCVVPENNSASFPTVSFIFSPHLSLQKAKIPSCPLFFASESSATTINGTLVFLDARKTETMLPSCS